uniref:ADAM metallopeptidase domain 9 n=1 Tax=Anser brachyrhynchus TaxID=132585 RepID=A0A8B9CSS8_9AVES
CSLRVLLVLGCFLLLGLLLPCGDCSPKPTWGSTSYEIVFPRKLGPKAGKASRDSVSYVISMQGVNYTIHLRQKKDFIVKNLPIFTRDSQGKIMIEQPRVLADCYYRGYVEGIPDSTVTLTTCSGLRGLLQIGNLSYSIEPLTASSASEHLLLQREVAVPGMVIYKTPQRGRQFPGRGTAKGQFQPWGRMRYLELLVVVDKEGFDAFGGRITNVTLEVIEIINLVDGLFSSFRLRVLLAVLEIWTEKNPISITKNVTEVLHNFNLWQIQQSPTHVAHDVGCLFASLDFGHSTGALYRSGKSNFASACDRKRASAVVSFAKDFVTFSIIFTHELGHNLGMEHDKKECVCGKATKCYMTGESLDGAAAFSNCSLQSFLDLLSRGDGECLNNIPEPNRFFYFKHCGNKVIDEGEQCDCGGPQHCRGNPCCYHDCRLKPGAVCSVGQCCQKCHFRAAGYKCRSEVDECDLPEYCNGTSEWCPEDLYMHDGTRCSDDGYCYRGKCATYDKLCRKIFGNEARGAPESCFKEQNAKGDRFGNCGGDGNEVAFVECKPQNALCGRLQCVNVRRIPFLEGSETIIQRPGSEGWCWGTAHHAGIDTPDIGGGLDGTKCGQEKICINKTCTDAVVRTKCDANVLCRGKGVCNNLEHCHCKAGWAPPYCQFHGLGGSVDSGPPPHLIISTAEAVQNKAFGTAIGIAVPVAIVLIALLIAAIKYINVIAAFFTTSSSTEVSETPEGEEQNKEEDDDDV